MIGNGHSRLGLGHDLTELGWGSVNGCSNVECRLGGKALFFYQGLGRDKGFVNGNVCALSVFCPPFVWIGIAAVGKFQAFPFKDKGNRTVKNIFTNP